MGEAHWITFFSQTGAEIADIAESIGRWPDRIITNERPEHLRSVDPRIEKQGYFTFPRLPCTLAIRTTMNHSMHHELDTI